MRRADLACLAFIALLITAAFADVIFGGACFFVRDLTRYYFPTSRLLHDIVASGDFPLWNPYFSAGQPLAANPEYEVFYPLRWLLFLPNFALGYRLHIVLHLFVASGAMYAFARSRKAGAGTAAIAAITFAFGGPLLSTVNLLPILFALAWLPLVLLWGDRYLADGRTRDLSLAALILGIQTLAFEPSVLLETCGFLVLIAMHRRWRLDRAATLILAGMAVAAVQVIPTADLLRHTSRAAGLSFDSIAYWSMPPSRIAELLQPHWFGHDPFTSRGYDAHGAYRQASVPYLQSLYIGLLPVVALTAALIRREKRAWIAVAVAAAAWIVAFGENTPLLRIAYATGLPIPLRFPERFAIAAAVVLTIASIPIIDRLRNEPGLLRTALGCTALIAAVALAATLFTQSGARHDWVMVLLRSVVLIALLSLGGRLPQHTFAAALLLFVCVDLVPLSGELTPRKPASFFDPPTVAAKLPQPAANYRIFFEPEWSRGSIGHRYFGDPVTAADATRAAMLPRLPAAWGFRTVYEVDIDHTELLPTAELTEVMWKVRGAGRRDWAEMFATMGNVELRAAYRPPPSAEPIAFVPVGRHPRYWFADEVVSGGDFVTHLISERHSLHAAYGPLPAMRPAAGQVVAVEERSHHVRLDVHAAGPALLVAANSFDPHWRATVDGSPAEILPANLAYQGLLVPPGTHRVELDYANPWITAGAVVTVLALAAMTALLALHRRQNPR